MNHCRIRLGLSYLNSHLHRYNLVDSPSCFNPDCGGTTESEDHYFLICPKFNNERRLLLENIYKKKQFSNVNYNTCITLMPKYICKVLQEGSIDASNDGNTSILVYVFKYIDSTKRFNTFQESIDTSTEN